MIYHNENSEASSKEESRFSTSKSLKITLCVRIVPFDQWFRIAVNPATSVAALKDEILLRARIGVTGTRACLESSLEQPYSRQPSQQREQYRQQQKDWDALPSPPHRPVALSPPGPSAMPQSFLARSPNLHHTVISDPAAIHSSSSSVPLKTHGARDILRGDPGRGGPGSFPFFGLGYANGVDTPLDIPPQSLTSARSSYTTPVPSVAPDPTSSMSSDKGQASIASEHTDGPRWTSATEAEASRNRPRLSNSTSSPQISSSTSLSQEDAVYTSEGSRARNATSFLYRTGGHHSQSSTSSADTGRTLPRSPRETMLQLSHAVGSLSPKPSRLRLNDKFADAAQSTRISSGDSSLEDGLDTCGNSSYSPGTGVLGFLNGNEGALVKEQEARVALEKAEASIRKAMLLTKASAAGDDGAGSSTMTSINPSACPDGSEDTTHRSICEVPNLSPRPEVSEPRVSISSDVTGDTASFFRPSALESPFSPPSVGSLKDFREHRNDQSHIKSARRGHGREDRVLMSELPNLEAATNILGDAASSQGQESSPMLRSNNRKRSGTVTARDRLRHSEQSETSIDGSCNLYHLCAEGSTTSAALHDARSASLATLQLAKTIVHSAQALDAIDFSRRLAGIGLNEMSQFEGPTHPHAAQWVLFSFSNGFLLDNHLTVAGVKLRPFELLELQPAQPQDRIRIARRSDPQSGTDIDIFDNTYTRPYAEGHIYIYRPGLSSRSSERAGLGHWERRWFLVWGKRLMLFVQKPPRASLSSALADGGDISNRQRHSGTAGSRVEGSTGVLVEWDLERIRWIGSERADGRTLPSLPELPSGDIISLAFGSPPVRRASPASGISTGQFSSPAPLDSKSLMGAYGTPVVGFPDVNHTVSLRFDSDHEAYAWFRIFQRAHIQGFVATQRCTVAVGELECSLRHLSPSDRKAEKQDFLSRLRSGALWSHGIDVSQDCVKVHVAEWRNTCLRRAIIAGRGGTVIPGQVGRKGNGGRNALARTRLRPRDYDIALDHADEWSDREEEEDFWTIKTLSKQEAAAFKKVRSEASSTFRIGRMGIPGFSRSVRAANRPLTSSEQSPAPRRNNSPPATRSLPTSAAPSPNLSVYAKDRSRPSSGVGDRSVN